MYVSTRCGVLLPAEILRARGRCRPRATRRPCRRSRCGRARCWARARRRRNIAAADAGAERDHEHDALAVAAGAEAHLGDAGGVGVVEDRCRASRAARSGPCPRRADPLPCRRSQRVSVTPFFTTAGNVAPTGPFQSKCSTTSQRRRPRLRASPACGVSMRKRSSASAPASTSTGAPLMPVPPMSTPISRSLAHAVTLLLESRANGTVPRHDEFRGRARRSGLR